MFLWKRAMLYLTRKKGRSVLLVMLLMVMSCFVLIGLSFKKSAEREADNLRQSLARGFSLEVNLANEAYREYVEREDGSRDKAYTGPAINGEMIDQILAIEGVTDYQYEDLMEFAWINLKVRPGAWAQERYDPVAESMGGWTMTEEQLQVKRNEILMWPCRNGELLKNFRTGALTISEGRNIQEGDQFKAVISEWLAEENGLSVGDTFTVEIKDGMQYLNSKEPMKTVEEPVTLEIAGLFHPNFKQQPSEDTFETSFIENAVYTDMSTRSRLNEIWGLNTDIYGKIEFFVNDPAEVDSVIQQIKASDTINLENMSLTVDNSDYEAAVKPYNQIRVFSMILLVTGLAGMGIILYLILKMWAQGRRHEVGVLLSIGIKKWKILFQMLAECLTLSAAALLLCFLLSGPLLDKCADVAERMTAPREDVEDYRVTVDALYADRPVITKNSSDEVVLEHSASGETCLFVVLFVCGISSASVCLSFPQISSMEPKKLLQSM